MKLPHPSGRALRRAALAFVAIGVTAGAFAAGVATQRVENGLAREAQCTRASNTVTCLIVLDEVLDDAVEPPLARG